jgi:hypothetical protein
MIVMNYGWGKHMWNVSLADLVEFNKVSDPPPYMIICILIPNTIQILLPNTLSYLICPAITKMAILSVLYRINPSTTYRYLVIAVTVAIFAYTITLCTITGAPCNPLKSGTTKCLENVALAQAVLNIATDLAVISLPIPTIHALQSSWKQKLTVGSLIALGSGYVSGLIWHLPRCLLISSI